MKVKFDYYITVKPKKKFTEEQLWKLLRKANKDGWNGEIVEFLTYYAEDEHLWGEHIFDAGKGEWGGSINPLKCKNRILKALKKFYKSDTLEI